MRTALNAFQDCVALCDRHGFGRVALPNRIMMGHCMTYSRQSNGAMAIVREAREIARRSGNPLTEMLANQSLGIVAALSGQLADAARHMTTALNQARNLGARRYEASILVVLAEWALHQGQPAEGLHLASEAVAISREVGMGFVGPHALAVLARATPNPVDRDKALTEGEALLPKSVGHNWIWFYRVAAYAHMDAKNWSEARRCADQMRAVTADEPLPLVEFITGQIYAACDMATPDL
jgi:hypothetical protein